MYNHKRFKGANLKNVLRPALRAVIFFPFIFAIGLSSWAKDSDCETHLSDPFIWSPLTGRSFNHLSRKILSANATMRMKRPIRLNAVVRGQRSLLVLGEGVSTFGLVILDRTLRHSGPDALSNIRMVDAIYRDATVFAADWPYKANYVGQIFQELDLRTGSGRRKFFDYVVSPWSLSFVLAHQAPSEQRGMLERIIGHVKPGGVIAIWPVGPLKGEAGRTVALALDRMAEERHIAGHELAGGFLLIYR